jgi:LppP/LprE lipoprotein
MRSFANRHRGLPACLAAGLIALGGCGSSGTKTVSISSAAPGTTAQRTTATGTTPSPKTTPRTSTAPPVGSQRGVEATRTSTAPAFAKQPVGAEGLDGALRVVKAHGYTVGDSSDYHADQTLRVLVGTRTGSSDGHGQQAFFFVGGRYIGTDASEPSASVRVVAQGDTEATLAYSLYRAHDPLCCPGGGQAEVRFQLNDGRLVALGAIPPVSSQTGLSRQ